MMKITGLDMSAPYLPHPRTPQHADDPLSHPGRWKEFLGERSLRPAPASLPAVALRYTSNATLRQSLSSLQL